MLHLEPEQLDILNTDNPDLDQLIENEWRIYLSQQAWEKVISTCKAPQIIQCYELILKGNSPEMISKKLSMSIDTIYVYRQRFKEKMSREISLLKEYLDHPS